MSHGSGRHSTGNDVFPEAKVAPDLFFQFLGAAGVGVLRLQQPSNLSHVQR